MRKAYAHHKPSPDGLGRIGVIRRAFSQLHDYVEGAAPPSRELSVALTHLETAAMWAIKAVVVNDRDSEVQEVQA